MSKKTKIYQFKVADPLKDANFHLRQFLSTKIRPQTKIDNFAFKNSNIIIKGLF